MVMLPLDDHPAVLRCEQVTPAFGVADSRLAVDWLLTRGGLL